MHFRQLQLYSTLDKNLHCERQCRWSTIVIWMLPGGHTRSPLSRTCRVIPRYFKGIRNCVSSGDHRYECLLQDLRVWKPFRYRWYFRSAHGTTRSLVSPSWREKMNFQTNTKININMHRLHPYLNKTSIKAEISVWSGGGIKSYRRNCIHQVHQNSMATEQVGFV